MEHLKVLIAEDEPITRMDLRITLQDLGVEVLGEAENGKQAVDLSRSLRPDLVIMDIMMPHMDGLEAARLLRQDQIAPVILLTGYADEDMILQANDAGVQAYVRKPFRRDDMMPALTIALGRYREKRVLEREIEDLKEKMEARKIVGRAKALLMERHNLTEREAFHRIQIKSQMLQKPTHEIARAIIMASELGV
ncbi:MAG: ANTAR domain-containing response regulator [Capsulimonadaceae bacterium]